MPELPNLPESISLCGQIIQSRRGFLALIWSMVTVGTFVSFVSALVFSVSSKNDTETQYYNYENGNNYNGEGGSLNVEVAVTSRAMAFAGMWTAVLAALLSIFGAVVLGFQSPTGQYYTCCDANVHQTSPLGLGSFIGALIMFANLTLVCSVLFGEFEIRDYSRDQDRNGNQVDVQSTKVQRSSMAFSIMCVFLTLIYAAFAALTYALSNSVMEENEEDALQVEALTKRSSSANFGGYLDERFHPRPSNATGFVAPSHADSGLA